jgi:hypothetical protein
MLPHERVNLRIHSDHKWPEKVVFDTMRSRLTPVANASPERDAVPRRRSGDRAADQAFHGLEGFFPHPLAGEPGSPLNIVG